MIDGSEKQNGWLNLELQSLHVIERCSKDMAKRPLKITACTMRCYIISKKQFPNL